MFTLLAALYDFPCQFSALIASALPVTTLADDFEPSFHTFTAGVPFPADFQNWLSNVWQGGEKAYAQTENVALTPGSDAADLNFSWYSA